MDQIENFFLVSRAILAGGHVEPICHARRDRRSIRRPVYDAAHVDALARRVAPLPVVPLHIPERDALLRPLRLHRQQRLLVVREAGVVVARVEERLSARSFISWKLWKRADKVSPCQELDS